MIIAMIISIMMNSMIILIIIVRMTQMKKVMIVITEVNIAVTLVIIDKKSDHNIRMSPISIRYSYSEGRHESEGNRLRHRTGHRIGQWA